MAEGGGNANISNGRQHMFLQSHFDTIKDVFNLEQIKYIEQFGEFSANPNMPQDPILKKQYLIDTMSGELKTYAKLVYQFFCTYFDRNISDMKDDNSFDYDDD